MRLVSTREQKSAETKEKILSTTKRMLESYDFKYLTVRNICEEAGVAYGSFYHHFGNKEELLHVYCKELFQRMLDRNPLPDFVNTNDYILTILWPMVVYARFCEIMGKPLVNYLYKTCSSDVFYETCFDTHVIPALDRAISDGYAQPGPNVETVRGRMLEDIEIMTWSVVSYWATVSEERYNGRPHTILERIVNKLLHSFHSDKYVREILEGDNDYKLFSDRPGVIDGIEL